MNLYLNFNGIFMYLICVQTTGDDVTLFAV
jgi:hypothetical protein